MFSNFESFADFLCKHDKTPNQAFYCLCLYSDYQNGNNRHFKKKGLLYKIIHPESPEKISGSIVNTQELKDLIAYGWIELGGAKVANGNYKGIDLCDLGAKFISDLEETVGSLSDEMSMVREFYDEYPSYITGGKGENIMLKNTSPEKIGISYLNAISHDTAIHQDIVKTVRKAKERGLIKCGIQNFINNKIWTQLEQEIGDKKEIGSIVV